VHTPPPNPKSARFAARISFGSGFCPTTSPAQHSIINGIIQAQVFVFTGIIFSNRQAGAD
jgi:hypothetical protein